MAVRQLNIPQGYALFEKHSHATRMHRHYGIELIYCHQGCFDLITSWRKYMRIQGAIIPSNMPHAFRCEDSNCQLLFLDPLSNIGRYVMDSGMGGTSEISTNIRHIELLFQNLGLAKSSPDARIYEGARLDWRIQKCLTIIHQGLTDSDLSIKKLCSVSFLSESRLSHLFAKQVGVPIRQYVLWNRLAFAISRTLDGDTLTSAGHAAGFVDSSHFHKVFLRMFGSSPFKALKN